MTNSINIVLFGNPHGMSQIGVDSYKHYEQTYYKTYTKDMPRKKFLISRLPDNTAVYTLVEYDLIAGKRPGGLFGMELRVKGAFHQQTEELLKFFEDEYVKHIEGSILLNTKDNGGGYCINNFSEREDVWQALLKDFQEYVDTHFTLDDSALLRLLSGKSTWEKVIEPGKAASIVQESNPISDYETRFSTLKNESNKLIAQRESEKDKRAIAEIDNALREAKHRLNELRNEFHNRDTTIPETKALINEIDFLLVLISSVLNKQIEGHEENNSEGDTKTEVPYRKVGKYFPPFPSRLPLNNIMCGVIGFVIAWFLFGVMEIGGEDDQGGKPGAHDKVPESLCEYYENTNLVPSFKDLKEAIQSVTKTSEYDKIRSIIQKAGSTVGWAYSASVKSALYEAAGRALINEDDTEDSTTEGAKSSMYYEIGEEEAYTSPYSSYKISRVYYGSNDQRIHVEIVDDQDSITSPIEDVLWLRVCKPGGNDEYEPFNEDSPSSCGFNKGLGTYKFELVDKTNDIVIDSLTFDLNNTWLIGNSYYHWHYPS